MVIIERVGNGQEVLRYDGTIDSVVRKCADGGIMFVHNTEPEFVHDDTSQLQIVLDHQDIQRIDELKKMGAL